MRAATERNSRTGFVLGTVLLVGYVVQTMFGPPWPLLAELQAIETYKIGSGIALAALLVYQWSLATRRLFDPIGAVRRHKLAGAVAPAVLYLHASRFGYGYLALLVWTYLGTLALGQCHGPIVRARAKALFTVWFVLHVATSLAVIVLGGYHVVIALAYE